MKTSLLMWVSLGIVVCNLYMLATSRLQAMIRAVAVQGILLSLLTLLLPNPAEPSHVIVLFALGVVVKGVVIPRYLMKAIRDVRVVRDVDPAIGYALSVTFGIVVSGAAFYGLRFVPLGSIAVVPLHASTAIAMACIGIFLIAARRNVVSQLIGYLVFENAGFILGLSVAAFQPLFVEMGALLDMLVGVAIMVMAVNHIHTSHDTISVHTLERLAR
jgi:hydrogenase-4 component E